MGQNFEIFTKIEILEARKQLKNWFNVNQRPLPWRDSPHPYSTWLCEIIMQQTRIDQGIRYWESFVSQWPDFEALANAESEDIMKSWQGLGYYSRARNLHKAAKIVALEWRGEFPTTAIEWQQLPGVGPYTAAAIASICFGDPTAAVDGNALRVMSRWAGIKEPIDKPAGRNPIEQLAQDFLAPSESGMHNQAVMELGALVCKPKSPACDVCPLNNSCRSRVSNLGQTPELPIKSGKTKVKPYALTFHVIQQKDKVLMRQRPENGIWGGLWEFPSSWVELKKNEAYCIPEAALGSDKSLHFEGQIGETFEHILSHRKLTIRFQSWTAVAPIDAEDSQWIDWSEAKKLPIPRAIDKNWEELEKWMRRDDFRKRE